MRYLPSTAAKQVQEVWFIWMKVIPTGSQWALGFISTEGRDPRFLHRRLGEVENIQLSESMWVGEKQTFY